MIHKMEGKNVLFNVEHIQMKKDKQLIENVHVSMEQQKKENIHVNVKQIIHQMINQINVFVREKD